MNNEPTKIEIELAARVAHIDRENAFLVYATFVGDPIRTAAALGIRPLDVVRLSDEGHWLDRLKPLLELSQSSKPGDLERCINRSLNFVQAHRLRMVIERILNRLTGMNADEFEEYFLSDVEVKGKDKNAVRVSKLSTRAVADLASALEKAHSATYAALGDTAKERQSRNESSPETASSDMYLKIAAAAAKVANDKSPRVQLLDAQLEIAEERAEQAVIEKRREEKPASPYDRE